MIAFGSKHVAELAKGFTDSISQNDRQAEDEYERSLYAVISAELQGEE